MAKLQKLNNKWYLTDTNFAPDEGSSVLFKNIPTYASFIDELNELCIVTIDGMTKNVGFESIEVIILPNSEQSLDNVDVEKAIANLFISPTMGGKFAAYYPNEDDRVIGYFETMTQARYVIYAWFNEHNIDIIRHTKYECEYSNTKGHIEIKQLKVIE